MSIIYNKHILKNGLRIIAHQMPSMRSVALGIWIKVGGRYEEPAHKGVAHFLEHLLFKGSRKYSCRRIKESLEGCGGTLNGFTSEELTCYLVKLPAEHLVLALDILSDMVINPRLSPDEVKKEKTVILEEIKMYKDLPQSYVHELLDELLWPAQPLGMSIAGSVESVSRMAAGGIASFKSLYYTPRNIVVSVAGRFQHEQFFKMAGDKFRCLKGKGVNSFRPAIERQKKPQLKVFPKDTEQTHLAMGFHSFRRDDPLKYALSLLHIILGANMSSRLFNELREKRGLAYEIGAQVKRFQETGAFIIHAGIDNRKVSSAIDLIIAELEKIRDKPVKEGELKRAKEFFLGQIALALEDTLDHMLWMGESTSTMGKVFLWEEIVKEIKGIGVSDIISAAKRIFRRQALNLALIGPLAVQEDKIYRRLNLK
ncbi:MAG: pitrilysin family protein [Candidatus Omnitrophota bacterium]